MRPIPGLKRLAVAWLVAAALTQVTGCTNWQPVVGATPESLTGKKWADLRLTIDDRIDFELSRVRVSSDSVIGVLGKVRLAEHRADTARVGAVLRRFAVVPGPDSTVGVPIGMIRRLERYSDPFGGLPIWMLSALAITVLVAAATNPFN
jgi:hypothetical protein